VTAPTVPISLRVLLVTEDPALAGIVLEALAPVRAPGVRVRQVRGLDAAIPRLAESDTDVVALDAGAGPASAIDALQRLRAAAPTMALVLLTHCDEPALAPRALHAGAEDVLVVDGVSHDGLLRSLRGALERHRVHGALRLQAEQHQAIVESSIQGIVIHQDGVVRYANEAIARLMGYESATGLIGQAAIVHVAPHERERLLAFGEARVRGGAVPSRYEFDALRRDGTLVRLECSVTAIEWQGRPALVSTMLDVSERRRAEEAMRALAEIGRELVGTLGLAATTEMIVSRVREVFSATLVELFHIGLAPDVLTCLAAAGGRAPADAIGRTIRVGEGLVGRAVAEGRPMWSLDILADPAVVVPQPWRDLVAAEGFRSGIAVPLKMGAQAVGALFLADPPAGAFSPERLQLLASFADRAALAVERTALYERAAGRAEKLAVLARVSSLIASATGSDRVLESVARAAISLLAAEVAGVVVDDPAAGVLRVGAHYRTGVEAPCDIHPNEIPHGQGVAAVVFDTRAPVFIEDVATEPRWVDRTWTQEQGLHAYAALPLVARDRVIGVLSIFFVESRAFSDEERELMGLLADQAAIAIDNARLLHETERQRRTAQALADLARLMAQSLDTAEVSARITASVQSLLGVTNTALFRYRPASKDLESLSLIGDHGPTDGKPIVYPLGFGAAGLAVQERRSVVTSDLLADPRIPQPAEQRARMEQAPFRAILAVPLLVPGRVVGALVLGDRVGRRFTDDEVQTVEAFADRAAVGLEAARLYAEVRDARDFLQSIAESSPDAIVTTDVHGRVTYWSPGAEETLGYPAREVLGRRTADLYVDGEAEARAVMARLRAEGRLRDYEMVIRARDGRAVTVSSSMALLRDTSGTITGTVGVVKDVTEKKMLEASFRQSQKMEAVGLLAGGIAHDFNNLMTVVIGRSELLLARLRAEDPVRRDIELFRKTATRAAELTRQLLAFSRKQVLQPKVLDLNTVVANLEPMLRRLIGEDVELRAVLAPGLGRVKADPGQVEQVLVNLAVNARDAMPRGGKLTIETGDVVLDDAYARKHPGMSAGPHVMLAVSDTGAGMDEATQARVFEPFFTTKEPGKGTGLGLSTVYGIVKQSGGSIWVYSEVGAGTAFKVYLPRLDGVTEPAVQRARPARAEGGSETILLVEDEEELREVARETLEVFGYVVLEAGNGADALRMAERHPGPIHLLLTDVVMPAMNGAELVRRLMPTRPEMAVLFVSGYTDDAIVHHGVLEPGTAFLEKPFSPDQLVRRVREVLGGARR
jgi:PAS domain S-box-containing protein